jgi:DNA-binding Lrp family transcriptional regulator
MKKRMFSLLLELLKSSKRSDRELAKVLGVSQPTVSRMRKRLEKEGFIRDFTIIPDFAKMGYQIAAFTFLRFSERNRELMEKAREWVKNLPSVVFAADGEGLGMGAVMVSIHKDYADYSRLISTLKQDWQPNLRDAESFLFSVKRPELVAKPFSLKYLAGQEEK